MRRRVRPVRMGSDTACHAAVESHVFVKHMASLDVFWKMLQEDSVKCAG